MPARFASAALLLSALLSLPAMAGERQWTVLSSGDGDDTHERWQVSATRLHTLPAFDPARAEPPLSVHQATAAARRRALHAAAMQQGLPPTAAWPHSPARTRTPRCCTRLRSVHRSRRA